MTQKTLFLLKNKKLLQRTTLFIVLFLFVLNVSAQNNNTKIALKTILQAIENQHQVNFNFLEKDVAPIFIEMPDNKHSIEEKINDLQTKTNLIFEKNGANFYTIYSKN